MKKYTETFLAIQLFMHAHAEANIHTYTCIHTFVHACIDTHMHACTETYVNVAYKERIHNF